MPYKLFPTKEKEKQRAKKEKIASFFKTNLTLITKSDKKGKF